MKKENLKLEEKIRALEDTVRESEEADGLKKELRQNEADLRRERLEHMFTASRADGAGHDEMSRRCKQARSRDAKRARMQGEKRFYCDPCRGETYKESGVPLKASGVSPCTPVRAAVTRTEADGNLDIRLNV